MPSMPSGPSVTMPSVGSGFYTPERSDFYSGAKQNVPVKPKAPTVEKKNPEAAASAQNQSSPLLIQANKTEQKSTVSSSGLGKISSEVGTQLTADDISSLSKLGVFGQISSLLGKGSGLQSGLLDSQNTVTASTVDSATLKQILAELTELKNQVNGKADENQGSDGVPLSDKGNAGTIFTNSLKKEPKILRFIVNGYDLLSTCKKIYFSEIETDGTFLLTGDRKYMSENQVRSETFYFYFVVKGSENGITKYVVTPAVSQDYENPYSFLYQLTQKSELLADRTGNLLTLRVNENGWKLDLLISLDKVAASPSF